MGNVIGDLIGNVNWDLMGNVFGDLMGNVIGDLIGNVNWDLIWNVIGDLILGKDCDFNLDVIGNVNGHVTGIDFGRNPGCTPPWGLGKIPFSGAPPRDLGKPQFQHSGTPSESSVPSHPHSWTREYRNLLRLTGGLSEPQITPRRWHRSRVYFFPQADGPRLGENI